MYLIYLWKLKVTLALVVLAGLLVVLQVNPYLLPVLLQVGMEAKVQDRYCWHLS